MAMKKRFLVATLFTLVGTSALAQSSFEGFYGQIATGYESNSFSSINGGSVDTPADNGNLSINAPNQTYGGMPLVLGLGYNFSVAPQWLIGLGVDYSAISQTSSSFNPVLTNAPGNTSIPSNVSVTASGASLQVSNRFNVFLAPGYAIDKDSLIYLKAGYSSVGTKLNYPGTITATGPDGSSTRATGQAGTSSSNTLSGYLIGLGYKQMITGGLYGFAEGNYMGYSSSSFSASKSYIGGSNNESLNPSLNSYQFLIGLGYKF